MNSGLRFVPALLVTFASVSACSSGDDDVAGTGGGAGSGGATGGSAGKGGSGGSAGSGTGGSAGSGTGGSAGGGSTGILAACHDWCVAQDDCNMESTVADCEEYTCTMRAAAPSGNIGDASVACQNAWKGFWSCLIASGDTCTLPGPCETQAGAIGTACQ